MDRRRTHDSCYIRGRGRQLHRRQHTPDLLFLRCTLWRQPAENLAESLSRCARVIVTGRLRQRSFETREGEKRTVTELEADEVRRTTVVAVEQAWLAAVHTPMAARLPASLAPKFRNTCTWGDLGKLLCSVVVRELQAPPSIVPSV